MSMEHVVKNTNCKVHDYLFLIWQLLKPFTFITKVIQKNVFTNLCIK